MRAVLLFGVVSFVTACSQGPSPFSGGGAGGGGSTGGGGVETGGGAGGGGGGEALDAGELDAGLLDGGSDAGVAGSDGGGPWVRPLDAYVKASNTDSRDEFGVSVSMSADGTTLVVGSAEEDSAATGIDGDQADDTSLKSGAAYVFALDGGAWVQQAYLKASNSGASDAFGTSVAVSADGTTVAVGAPGESSAAIGINGAQNNNASSESGAVYVFVRTAAGWAQQAYVKASNADPVDLFGSVVTLSADGNTLAVGAPSEAGNGVNANQADNSATGAGAVYVFTRTGTTWAQQGYLKASNASALDFFGSAVSLSGDGATLAVGASGEDSAATGVGGNQQDNNRASSGAAYVFTRSSAGWTQQAYVKASNTGAQDFFGSALSLNGDGTLLAVGAFGEGSKATGVGGDEADNTADDSGAVYVFALGAVTWSQQAYLKASNTGALDFFGMSVALSADGSRLVVGASGEDSLATAVNGNQADNSGARTGAAYVFGHSANGWAQEAYLKAPNAGAGDEFGWAVSVNRDGTTGVVAGYREDSQATGVNGNQADDTLAEAGAVYVFRR